MGDSTETLPPPADSIESLSCAKVLSSPSQTLDRQSTSPRTTEVDHHANERMSIDPEPQEQAEIVHESEINPLMSTEVLDDSDEPLPSPSGAEANATSQPLSPLAVDDTANNIDDETDAWISCNRNESEGYKPMPSVASSSSSWYEDVYEKPSLVGAGLANLGNTCFFNAVMQCFTHSVLLVQGLYSYNHPTPCDYYNERFCLICALREHIELSLTSSGKIISPWKFVDNLSYFSSSFQRFQQEDSHEFLQCFLDRLESSLSNSKAKDASPNDNLVKQLFGGCVVSKLRCCNCNHISDTYEPSVDLSLEIDDANNLLTALDSFTKVEHIEDEEMKFTCDECKEKVSVEKQLMLDQTPPICTFHLKRFKNDGSYVEKIDKHVEFPLELDLQPYTCGNQSNNVDLKYELYAVVVHTAFTLTCGHYYCYIRSSSGAWYKFDDSKVSSVTEAHVLSEEAYILFYAKQGTPWFSSFMETYKPCFDPNLSNTSPKSVLEDVDHASTSLEKPNVNLHNNNESISLSRENKAAVSAPLMPIKEVSPSSFKEYGSNHKVKVEKNNNVTPTSGKPTFDIDQILSPSTPPRSPGFDDISDDENTEVVFAAKPEQLKLVEKSSSSYKRPRNKEVEDAAKQEALRQCKRMPGARANLLLAALSGEGSSVNKRSKKMGSPPRKNMSKSSDGVNKYYDNSISRNLATSSFR